MGKTRKPMEGRFWDNVKKGEPDQCWEWTGERMTHPITKAPTYGRFFVHKGLHTGAHRASWMIHFGEIPKGMCVLHKCDNPPCVNPDHLELGTLQKNALDRYKRGRVPPYRGTMVNTSKLTDFDIPVIRRLRSEGLSYREIGKRYGVHGNSIRDIILGKSWKHVA